MARVRLMGSGTVPPLPDRLPARTPGENPITRLTEERDGVMVSLDLLTKERDELAAERDDLAARSLPSYYDVLDGVYEPEVRPILDQMPGQGCEPLVVPHPEAVKCLEHDRWMPAYALAEHSAEPHLEMPAYEGWH